MKLLIIFPNSTDVATVSTAVPILAAIAKKRKWEIEYFDTYEYQKSVMMEEKKDKTGGFKFAFEIQHQKIKSFNQIITDLQEQINSFKPDIIAITALSLEYDFLMTFFPKISIPSYSKVIIGGVHATLMPDKTAQSGMFDLVAAGEGEETFDVILSKFENKEPIDHIDGTYFYNKVTKELIKNPKRRLLVADKLWEVDHEYSFFKEEYFIRPFDGKQIRRNDIEISRGCPYNCSYCANSALKEFNRGLGKFVKTRPIESSMRQMKYLVDNFKIDIFSFMDECFLSHPTHWIKEFMDAYKMQINKPYFFMTRSETITDEKIELLKGYGIPFQISIGVESGSDEILLNVCNRTCTTNKILKAFKIMNKHKIRTNTFFIVGFPFETREKVWQTINLCRKIKPSVASVNIFQPYPGLEITRDCVDNHFLILENVTYGLLTSDSLLNMPPPYLSAKEIKNIWRVFMLYAILPKRYYKQIEKCEKDYENNKDLYDKLIKLRWDKYDLAEKKGDIKLM